VTGVPPCIGALSQQSHDQLEKPVECYSPETSVATVFEWMKLSRKVL